MSCSGKTKVFHGMWGPSQVYYVYLCVRSAEQTREVIFSCCAPLFWVDMVTADAAASRYVFDPPTQHSALGRRKAIGPTWIQDEGVPSISTQMRLNTVSDSWG